MSSESQNTEIVDNADIRLNKSLNDSKNSKKKGNYEKYKNYKKNAHKKDTSEKHSKNKKMNNLPKIKINRDFLTSAKLRALEVSEKFIPEAKFTVYVPQTHSLLPRSIARNSKIYC